MSVCAPAAAELDSSVGSVETGVTMDAAPATGVPLDAGIAAAEELALEAGRAAADELGLSGALDTGMGTITTVETADAVTVTLAVVSPITMTLGELSGADGAAVVMVTATSMIEVSTAVVVGRADAALDAGATVTICVDCRVVYSVCVSVTENAELIGAGEEAGGADTGELAGGTSAVVLEVAGIAAALDVERTGAGTGTTVTETGITVVETVAGQFVTVAGHAVTVIS